MRRDRERPRLDDLLVLQARHYKRQLLVDCPLAANQRSQVWNGTPKRP